MDKIGTTNVNKELLDAFSFYDDKAAATILKSAITEGRKDRDTNLHWSAVRSGTEAMTFDELTRVVRAFNDNNLEIKAEKLPQPKHASVQTPLTDPAFLQSLAHHFEDTTALHEQLQLLHGQCLQEKGFLQKAFNIFADQDSLAKVMHDVETFETYCRDNHISFNAETQQLEVKDRPEGLAEKLYEWRFLVAAVAGATAGAAGLDTSEASTTLADYPSQFFGTALPWFVVPFTGLSLFKTCSQPSVMKDAKVFGRFAAAMTVGAALSIGIVNAEKHFGMFDQPKAVSVSDLPPTPEVKKEEAAQVKSSEDSVLDRLAAIKPSQYMMDVVGLSIALGLLYGRSKRKEELGEDERSKFDDLILTKFTAVDLETREKLLKALDVSGKAVPGKALVGASNFMDKSFAPFMTFGGLPAIFLSLNHAVAENGLGQFGKYAGLYETAFGSMAIAGGIIVGALYGMGVKNKEDWKAVADIATTAFSTSSGAATIPTIKKSLEKLGVSESTRDLAPLATSFNMVGPTVCLGAITLYANEFFGHEQTIAEQVETLSMVLVTMLGVRGVPASNIALLSPILDRQGLAPNEVKQVYDGVLGTDRLLDMCETVVNTLADTAVLMWHEKAGQKKIASVEPPKAEMP
jgi:Na+/H+-dicarboxylate symporter